jgi:hypothetical protein
MRKMVMGFTVSGSSLRSGPEMAPEVVMLDPRSSRKKGRGKDLGKKHEDTVRPV